ncbi:hypothetical protein [Mesonia sp. K7]|uniref:hypothetical protein n=1 Tax=Mesonia sp. K7 TaxID=2218606 RepID=UPI000DA860BB|nr:hypothetical protein [Mesonia sp. K7]PZD78031.1 hypothetical protein DNG35_06545 [Mesonia sp. K7]
MNPNNTWLFLTLQTLKLVAAGAVIGIFHEHDFALMLFLATLLGLDFFLKRRKKHKQIYFIGIITTGVLGLLAEFWGVYNNHWEYHNIDGKMFPYWLVFAWAWAFKFLYKIELFFVKKYRLNSLKSKLLLTVLVAAIFPTLGEMITIYLGVWTYAWPYQILGVPLYAIGLLVVFHTGVSWLLIHLNKYLKAEDQVFGVKLNS